MRSGGYFETIKNGADQFISNPSKTALIGFGVVALHCSSALGLLIIILMR